MENEKTIKIEEGLASFYIFKKDLNKIPSKSMNVFYNKRMILNRDLTILALNAYKMLYKSQNLTVVDSMAASGVGSIRILLECADIKRIYVNDINPITLTLIENNLELNNLSQKNFEIYISNKDANALLTEINEKSILSSGSFEKPDVISIDPFGTPNIFLDTAFKAIKKESGMLCITATDSAVLFGVKPEACLRKYLSKPLHNEYCKEIGARILLHYIARIANINRLGVLPLLTFYSDHFIRIFVLTFKNIKQINESFKNYGYVIHCNTCGFRKTLSLDITRLKLECPSCKSQDYFDYGGPLWIGKLHEKRFLELILTLNQKAKLPKKNKLEKLLKYMKDEIELPPSYYHVHKLIKQLKLENVPKMETILKLIEEQGFNASRTHFDFTSIKTDMDLEELKSLLKKKTYT